MVAQFGADSTRVYSLFATSPDRELDWQEAGVEGVHRFLSRTYRFVMRHADVARKHVPGWTHATPPASSPKVRAVERKLHQTIQRVTQDFQGRWHFNTSIAAIMEFVNELYGAEAELATEAYASRLGDALQSLVLLLVPFAPFLAYELWEAISPEGRDDANLNLIRHRWPDFNPALAKEDEITYAVQINGKLRSHVVLPAESPEDTVREHVLADEKVRAAIADKQVAKVIVVPGKLVNVVVK